MASYLYIARSARIAAERLPPRQEPSCMAFIFLLRSGLLIATVGGVYALSSGLRDWLQGQIQDDFGRDLP